MMRFGVKRYRYYETTFGYGSIVFSAEPFRLEEVSLPKVNLKSACQSMKEIAYALDDKTPEAVTIVELLTRYFAGEKIDIPWKVMDLSRYTLSQQAV
jgi:methylated-DNA-[protein]-cysteine S-methyltransferase